ncbi:peroxisomal membrane protein 11B [Fopius arisanus]|uniref:Peroxisomal membrane protein 11B n=1 Tax=Fopius arisanus TaxID=64838 RepID=A0A9R1TTU9_9HYME|nr:PREDICTED: peroxisomal membrane protein 11B [Fopius arisanus]XP_011314939.1 PREDICTED: peroxisomal membrane protein 11B [Fopius arisanus]
MSMDLLIKVNNQSAGRDKIARFFQYGSRAGWYLLQNGETTRNSVDILKSLEYTFSSFRKLLRFGRSLDSLYSALSTIKNPDLVIRFTLTFSKIANGLFLLADHIIWIGRAGLFRINLEKWTTVANKYWLFTIVMNLVRDLYEIMQIIDQNSLHHNYKINLSIHDLLSMILCYSKNHKSVFLDILKNGCDFFIPMTALGYTKLNPGTIGLLGLISSIVGLYCLIDPLAKLSPS